MADIVNVYCPNWYIGEGVNKSNYKHHLVAYDWYQLDRIVTILEVIVGAIDPIHRHNWVAYNWMVESEWYQKFKRTC